MTIEQLRAHLADLKRRAAIKIAEQTDGLAPEAVRAIETEHADLVRQASETQAKITAEETRLAALPAPVDGIAVERARTAEITTLAIRHGMPADFAAKHIAAGTAIDTVRGLVLDAVATRAAETVVSGRVHRDHRRGRHHARRAGGCDPAPRQSGPSS
jgi:hypothetical protein